MGSHPKQFPKQMLRPSSLPAPAKTKKCHVQAQEEESRKRAFVPGETAELHSRATALPLPGDLSRDQDRPISQQDPTGPQD